jgi:NADH-quinone oxidoreductase subunit G
VQVKARSNQSVNKEWMCDEGRYGFTRFLPKERISAAQISGATSTLEAAIKESAKLKGQNCVVFVDPHATLEEMWALKNLVSKHLKGAVIALAYRKRELSKTQAVLISPDFAPNFRGFEFLGLSAAGDLEAQYEDALAKFRSGVFKTALFVGDGAVLARDLNPAFLSQLAAATMTVGILTDGEGALAAALKVVLPGRSVLEKSGMMVNRDGRLQYLDRVLDPLQGSVSDGSLINSIAEALGGSLFAAGNDRDVSLALLKGDAHLASLKIAAIKGQGAVISKTQ